MLKYEIKSKATLRSGKNGEVLLIIDSDDIARQIDTLLRNHIEPDGVEIIITSQEDNRILGLPVFVTSEDKEA